MKGKIPRILSVALALVLVLSFSLVMAVPAAAEGEEVESIYGGYTLDKGGDGTAVWVTGAPADFSGDYSALLTAASPDNAAVGVQVSPTPLNNITELSFKYKHEAYNPETGHVVGPDLDIALSNGTDYYLTGGAVVQSSDAWKKADAVIDADSFTTGGWWLISCEADGTLINLLGTYADFEALQAAPALNGAMVIGVIVNLEPQGTSSGSVYVDDIKVNDVVYDLEPIVLDKSFYKTGDTVNVKVLNGNESGTISIQAKSDTVGDASVTIALHETGTGTGVFNGSFDLVGTTPAAGELLVNDSDTITVTYAGDWGVGLAVPVPTAAIVDNTAPTITGLSPADEQELTDPMSIISADLTDVDGSGIDELTAEMTLDGNVVKTIYESNTLTHTPLKALADGAHDVTVDVSDTLGNAAKTEEWSFTIIDTWVTTPEFSPANTAIIHTASPVVRVSFGEVVTITEATLDDEDVVLTTTDNMTFRLATEDLAVGKHAISVTAEDSVGNTGDFSSRFTVVAAVVTKEIDLYDGWNLISLPLIPENSDIEAVISDDTLGDVSNVSIVRAYNSATGEFLPSYVPEAGSGDLATMEDGYGYWVFMDAADTLAVTGTVMPVGLEVPPFYDVVVGWNLIGLKSVTDRIDYVAAADPGKERGGYLLNIAGAYPVLWSYDAEAFVYSDVKGVEDGMEVGHGFWLWATETGTIIPIPEAVAE